jgi:transposase InsO family protein
MIRSDNGTEFMNYTLNDFLSDEGIRHQYSTPYTPQQSGVAEQKNRTLMDIARTMLVEFNLRITFGPKELIRRVMRQISYISARA